MKHYLETGDRIIVDSAVIVLRDNGEVALDPDFGLIYATDPSVFLKLDDGTLIEAPLHEDDDGAYYDDQDTYSGLRYQEDEADSVKAKDAFDTFI